MISYTHQGIDTVNSRVNAPTYLNKKIITRDFPYVADASYLFFMKSDNSLGALTREFTVDKACDSDASIMLLEQTTAHRENGI